VPAFCLPKGLRLFAREDFLYPFTAIVNQETLKTALILNAVNPEIGGVLIRGPSGTAKSTAVRGFTALLPQVEVVEDCPFQCDPHDSRTQCDACRDRSACGETLPVVRRIRRLVNLPLNATEDRVAGTLDISQALHEGVKALEPGLLAEVNRGILYIDEINLLDDHIINLLLDAAALGINVVEREGISLSHPSRFLLIGTMNPEEGELRPQIADRIGLQIEIGALSHPDQRVEVMKRREAFLLNPASFSARFSESQERLRHAIERALVLLPKVTLAERLYEAIAHLTLKSDVPSHRADITMLQCAKALAALEGRTEVSSADIWEAATLALGHRLPHDPFIAGPALDPMAIKHELEDFLEISLEPKKKATRMTQAL
jgi:Mg-chelatase subunit ChlI